MERLLAVLLGLMLVTADCEAGIFKGLGRAIFGRRESPGKPSPGGDSRVPSPGPSAPFLEDYKTFPKHVQSAAILSTVTIGYPGMGCTGSIVGWERKPDGDFWCYGLSAAHCVGRDGKRVRIGLVWRDGQKHPGQSSSRKEVIGHTIRGDLVLIKFSRKRGDGIPYASPIRSDIPSIPFDVLSLGQDQAKLPWMWSGKVTGTHNTQMGQGRPAKNWTVNRQPSGGRSGGPLFDVQGRVVGVCSTGGYQTGGYIHLSEIQALCDQAGVSWLYKSVPYVPPARGPDPGIIIAPTPSVPIKPIGYYERVPILIDCQPGRS